MGRKRAGLGVFPRRAGDSAPYLQGGHYPTGRMWMPFASTCNWPPDSLTTRLLMPGRSLAIASCPAAPTVSSAVDSASVSVAEGRTTAASTVPMAGSPVRGSMMWPYVLPAAWKELSRTPETDMASSFSGTVASRVGDAAGAVDGVSMAIFQNASPGGGPNACTVLVPPWIRALVTRASRRDRK